LRGFKTDAAKDRAGFVPRSGGEKHHVAFLDGELGGDRGFLGVGEEFHDGRLPFALLGFDECEAFRAEGFRDVFERLELALREVGESLGVERLDRAAAGNGALEHLERGVLEGRGEVGEFHAEAHVGLVHAEAVHRVVIRQAQERGRNVDIENILPNFLHHAFEDAVNILARDKRRLDVHLGELHLAVGAQVFVAEAARDLEITFHAGDHENLFKLLGRLRERVEFAGVDARRHEIFARAFGRGFEERGRLDFDELLGVEVVANRLRGSDGAGRGNGR